MYALCVSGAVNMQGFVWRFLCSIYKFSFIVFIPRHTSTKQTVCTHSTNRSQVYLVNTNFSKNLFSRCLHTKQHDAIWGGKADS